MDRYMYAVFVAFVQRLSDGSADAEDGTDLSLCIFDAHVDDVSPIWDIIKCGIDLPMPSMADLTDIPREMDIRPAVFRDLMDHRFIFIRPLLASFLLCALPASHTV